MSLHPEVWAVYPRMDVIHANMMWQQKYNVVNYNHVKNVKEMIYAYGGGAKPWRQKGTGKMKGCILEKCKEIWKNIFRKNTMFFVEKCKFISGRARQGSRRAPQWIKGGKVSQSGLKDVL